MRKDSRHGEPGSLVWWQFDPFWPSDAFDPPIVQCGWQALQLSRATKPAGHRTDSGVCVIAWPLGASEKK